MEEIDGMYFDLNQVITIGKLRIPENGKAWYSVHFTGGVKVDFYQEDPRVESAMPYCDREELVEKINTIKGNSSLDYKYK